MDETDIQCKWCKKPIEDAVAGFCKSLNDSCWKAWLKHQKETRKYAIGMRIPGQYLSPLYEPEE